MAFVALTWTFGGLLSMDPFPQLSSEGITSAQRRAVAGQPPPLSAIEVDAVGIAVAQASDEGGRPRRLRLLAFGGGWYWRASTTSVAQSRLVPALAPSQGSFAWLSMHDEYDYSRRETLPLPVLRARYDDPEATWAYLDPSRGAMVRVVRRPERWNR